MTTDSLTSNTATIGLSKDLAVAVVVKVGELEPADSELAKSRLASSSQKYANPAIFHKLSNISYNSDVYLRLQVLDGANNALCDPVSTAYQPFSANRRRWNRGYKLPINYNQLPPELYLRVEVFEIVEARLLLLGAGTLSMFNTENSTLRKGSYKVGISSGPNKVEYGEVPGTTPLEQRVIDYDNGEFPRLLWLDRMALDVVGKEREEERRNKGRAKSDGSREPSADATETSTAARRTSTDTRADSTRSTATSAVSPHYFLLLELPNFDLPIVYSSNTCPVVRPPVNPSNVAGVESPTIVYTKNITVPHTLKISDPDFTAAGPAADVLDPIDFKYHKLERNINNNSVLDKELKPTPQLRDQLVEILSRPSNAELSDIDKNLVWKYRYYFSKNTMAAADDQPVRGRSTKLFLPKFLKAINWDNDYELDHTFGEIIPTYWSVDKIHIGDALELLSSYFNPYSLTSDIRRRAQDDLVDDDKFKRIFNHVVFLRNFAVDRLRLASADELLLYLLQLVQALKYELVIFEKTKSVTLDDDDLALRSPLASFLIQRAVESSTLGNFFYWYIKVENEDQLMAPEPKIKIYPLVLNKYIEQLKKHSSHHRLPTYNNLKRQIWFIKKLTSLVELIRTSFKKNEATSKKVQFLREYLADPANGLLKFDLFPLPLDPSVTICGCYPEESSVFKSSLAPLKITFKTSKDPSSSQMFAKKSHGKYALMFKIGDDLRQDQLVIQIINLMDQLLKTENLDLRLTPYKILATSPIAGLIQFVPNQTLDAVLAQSAEEAGENNLGILGYLKLHSQESQTREPEGTSVLTSPRVLNESTMVSPRVQTTNLGVSSMLMDNYVKSCAGYCVITYLLGVGDRHLDNLLISPNGKFWHADFGYILGRDPKPFPPLMKLPIQVVDGMGGLGHENFDIFKSYCFIAYTTLRKNSNLILNLFQLMLDANIPDIKIDPKRAVDKVEEKFCLEMSEEEAILHFQNLINDSVNAFLPVVIDRLHSLAQYWRA